MRSRLDQPHPLAPFARAKTQSLVEHSPSTVIALKVSSTAAFSARCSSAGSTFASVVTNPSIVAMFGSIIPEPLAMPPTRKRAAPALEISTAASFGNGSVVMIARAASPPPVAASAAAAAVMPRSTFAMSSLTPMTPVDATSTAGRLAAERRGGQLRSCASACVIPSGPVHALAQPLLTTIARDAPAGRRQLPSRDDDGRRDCACWS